MQEQRLPCARTVAAIGAVTVASLLAATSTASGALAGAADTTLKIKSDKVRLAFDKKKLEATAGKVTLVMENPSFLSHNVAVKGNGVDVKGKVVGKGGTSTVSVKLAKGTYRFYCSLPGHEAGGQWGTLTVR